MQDNTMKTKTKHTKNQMNKYSTTIQTALLQAACVPHSALVLSYSGQNRDLASVDFLKVCRLSLEFQKDICFVSAFTCGF